MIIPARMKLGREEQHAFTASLGYTVSSGLDWAIVWNSVSTYNKKREKQEEQGIGWGKRTEMKQSKADLGNSLFVATALSVIRRKTATLPR